MFTRVEKEVGMTRDELFEHSTKLIETMKHDKVSEEPEFLWESCKKEKAKKAAAEDWAQHIKKLDEERDARVAREDREAKIVKQREADEKVRRDHQRKKEDEERRIRESVVDESLRKADEGLDAWRANLEKEHKRWQDSLNFQLSDQAAGAAEKRCSCRHRLEARRKLACRRDDEQRQGPLCARPSQQRGCECLCGGLCARARTFLSAETQISPSVLTFG